MILSFKQQFPSKILDGSKVHSMREDPHNRWKVDRKIHMATGVRTKNYNCFKEDVCRGVQKININHRADGIVVSIDGKIFSLIKETGIWFDLNGMQLLAKNDGFDSIGDFFKWFNTDFEGKIIHWSDFRY